MREAERAICYKVNFIGSTHRDAFYMTFPQNHSNLLLIDDDENLTRLLTITAKSRGWRPAVADNALSGLSLLSEHIKAVVLDYQLPDAKGIDVLPKIRGKFPNVPVIMLTGHNDAETAVHALRAGADDYVTKPFDLEHLFTAIHESIKRRGQQIRSYKPQERQDGKQKNIAPPVLESNNPAMKALFARVEKVAGLDITLLLTGESGTGKTYLARKIHALSGRMKEPFIPVSCPALPSELLESELFGHEKGAFTGATAARKGRFEQASKGTIFLDEIGDLPHALQPKLLNILQDREFFRVGGSNILRTDARVIAATNADLRAKVMDRTFREDLFYRLNIVEIRMPSLGERSEDIPALTLKILSRIAAERGVGPWEIDDESLALMASESWPGNIRQLENFLERTTAFADGEALHQDLIQSALALRQGQRKAQPSSARAHAGAAKPMTLPELEKEQFMRAYRDCSGKRSSMAERLGISERTVYNRLARYGLK